MVSYDFLVVEDDPALQRMWGKMPLLTGKTIKVVGTLQALESMLEDATAGCYILDGKFPREDSGREDFLAPAALESIRAKHPDARVVLYSDSDGCRQLAHSEGVDIYQKSIVIRDLVVRLAGQS